MGVFIDDVATLFKLPTLVSWNGASKGVKEH